MKSEAPVYRETSEPGSDVIILIHSFDSYEGKNMWIKSLFQESLKLIWWEQSRYFTWWRHKNDILTSDHLKEDAQKHFVKLQNQSLVLRASEVDVVNWFNLS